MRGVQLKTRTPPLSVVNCSFSGRFQRHRTYVADSGRVLINAYNRYWVIWGPPGDHLRRAILRPSQGPLGPLGSHKSKKT